MAKTKQPKSKEAAKPKDAPKIINGVVQDNVLLNEHGQKFRGDWSPQQCVDELRRVAQMASAHDRFLSRNFFRYNAIISDGTWDRYFGTFEEFRRQGGIDLPRGAHRLELHIARHASKDVYREMNLDKRGWEGKYLKPCNKRFQTVIGCNDLHDTECDAFWRRVFIDTVIRVQPDIICIDGDGLDLPEFGKYSIDPRVFEPLRRLKWMHEFLRELREAAPDAEIVYIEGNHEHRFLRWLADAGPAGTAMKVILSDLHGMSVADFFGLTKYEVNYIARTDLAAENASDIKKELRKNYHVMYDCLLACHFPDALTMGLPGWNGHHHNHLVDTRFSALLRTTYEWHQFGAGHRRWAEYTGGEKWSTGFGLWHVDTEKKLSQCEYVDTTADHAVVGGKWYLRQANERISLAA